MCQVLLLLVAVEIGSFPAIDREVPIAEASHGDKNRAEIFAVFKKNGLRVQVEYFILLFIVVEQASARC